MARPARKAQGGRGASGERGGAFTLEQVAAVQRARLIGAMARAACERGGANVSVADVVAAAGVSRRTFYELFSSGEDCLAATFDDAIERVAARVEPAWRGAGSWQQRVRAALVEVLAFCEEQPPAARVLLVESLAGGALLSARREEVHKRLVGAIDEGRKGLSRSTAPPALTAEGVVGGVLSVLAGRLGGVGSSNGKRPDLLSLTSSLTSMIVLPYLGAGAARKEAARPAPQRVASSSAPDRRDGALDLRDAGMRITYRTLRVLLSVDEHPDGSNRLIGESAGMHDQGQISKLLARLARIGLIENTHAHPGKGAPNSWALTEKGRRIAEAMRAQTGKEAS
jgi:AcrR family transcriptional regulator